MKSRALLALLASSENGQRGRRWLESVLWGNATNERAKTSLRQEWAKLKKDLYPLGVRLTSNRRELSLDLSTIQIFKSEDGDVFLEGMYISEPNFLDWLNSQRHSNTPQSFAPNLNRFEKTDCAWKIIIAYNAKTGPNRWFAQLFGDAVASNINEMMTIPVLFDKVGTEEHKNAFRVETEVHSLEARMGIRVTLSRCDNDQKMWIGSCDIPSSGAPPIEDPKVVGLITQLIASVRHHLFRMRHEGALTEPDALYEQAIRNIFSMDVGRVAAADKLLARAYEYHPRGLFLAARAQIRAIQRVERFSTEIDQLIDEAEEFLTKSMEDEPGNSMVLALVSNTAGHLMRSPDRSLEFAGRSVKINPSNPMAWWSLSSANMYIGNVRSSLEYAVKGLQLAEVSQFRFWWDQQAFGAAYSLGRYNEALQLAKRVNLQNPSYRPPLRYLISLYAHFGLGDEVETAVQALRKLEPDFQLRQMYEDPAYPASLIHKSPGLDVEALREFFS
ncbi:hypothetical protein [Yoonia sp. R2-816]|uniref:hypothetical protein n=1 Tax=Yoonia sp. R2-816 TaxID=3342638 RepID=UPI00372D85B0